MKKYTLVKQFVVSAEIITQISAKSREEALEQLIKQARMHLPLSIDVMEKDKPATIR